jgi:RNA recognition motif-containing protein
VQTKLIVRNLAYNTTEAQLEAVLALHGPVVSASFVRDVSSGDGRGIAVVEMATQVGAEAAIKYLNLRELNGRQLNVKFADDSKNKKSRTKRRSR